MSAIITQISGIFIVLIGMLIFGIVVRNEAKAKHEGPRLSVAYSCKNGVWTAVVTPGPIGLVDVAKELKRLNGEHQP